MRMTALSPCVPGHGIVMLAILVIDLRTFSRLALVLTAPP
jgi:hypothetical protein